MGLLDVNLQEVDDGILANLCIKEFRREFYVGPEWRVIYDKNELLSLDTITSYPQQYAIAGFFDGDYTFFIKILNIQIQAFELDDKSSQSKYYQYPQLTMDKVLKNI